MSASLQRSIRSRSRPVFSQELHASHVESTLLSQVRVAVVGQEIDVWVLGRTRVRLNVGKQYVQSISLQLPTGYAQYPSSHPLEKRSSSRTAPK